MFSNIFTILYCFLLGWDHGGVYEERRTLKVFCCRALIWSTAVDCVRYGHQRSNVHPEAWEIQLITGVFDTVGHKWGWGCGALSLRDTWCLHWLPSQPWSCLARGSRVYPEQVLGYRFVPQFEDGVSSENWCSGGEYILGWRLQQGKGKRIPARQITELSALHHLTPPICLLASSVTAVLCFFFFFPLITIVYFMCI